MPTLEAAIQLSERLLAERLATERWFVELSAPVPRWDLLLLAGSVTRGTADHLSDIDLFLVLPLEVQSAVDLQPVHVYSMEGVTFEVSKFSTEKLQRDAVSKRGLFIWHGARVLRAPSQAALQAFNSASTLTDEELRDRLWSRYALYEIYLDKIDQLAERGEPLSFSLCLHKCVEVMADAVLSASQRFPERKWLGRELRNVAPEIYAELLALGATAEPAAARDRGRQLRHYLVELLLAHGFSQAQVADWSRCNLTRLTLQR